MSAAPSLIVVVHRGQVECLSDAPLDVALLDHDTAGVEASELVSLRSLKNRPARWEPVEVQIKSRWVANILGATPEEDIPEVGTAAAAQKVILSMHGGVVEACNIDGSVRVLVLDRDPHDPDDLLTYPGERFADGETFEAAREWLEPSIVPIRVVEAFEEVARARAPARRRPSGP